MRRFQFGLLFTGFGLALAGCNLLGFNLPKMKTPPLAALPEDQGISIGYGMTLSLLPEGQGITRLPSLVKSPGTEQVFWTVPFYCGSVGGHAVIGKVGQLPQQLDDKYKSLRNVSWSQDGQRMALTVKTGTKIPEAPYSSICGNERDAIYINDPGGTTFRTLLSEVNTGRSFLSPGGDKLLVRSCQDIGPFVSLLFDLSNNTKKTIPLGSLSVDVTSYPLWSPDGTKIAILYQRHQLIIHDVKTGKESQIETSSDTLIGWTQDSKTLYTWGTEKSLVLSGFTPDGSISSTASIELPTNPTGNPEKPMLSPDGTRLAFVLEGLISQGVYLTDVHGGTCRQVVPPSDLLGWLDPSTLVCAVLKEGNLQVEYSVDLAQR